MSEEYEVVLKGGSPWGIRLQGGVGTSLPLQIAIVTPRSKAAEQNVRNGSSFHHINGTDARRLTMTKAEDLIKRTGDTLRLGLRVPPMNNGGGFDEEITNPSTSGEANWGNRVAQGNTFNMMKEHVEAGQGNRVLSQFDVARDQRNKAIPTTAPKVHQHITNGNNNNNVDSQAPSQSNPAHLVVMRGGKPWGMRLKGGEDSGTPLSVGNVNPASKAYNEGLLVNDHIVSINDQPTHHMTLLDAQDIVRETGDQLKLYITREAMAKRLVSAEDEDFFNDLKLSMGGGGSDRRGKDVKGNAFKMLQQVVDSK